VKEIDMSIIKKLFLIFITAFFMVGLSGCPEEGPAERAGEKIDEAVEDAGEKMEETGEKAGEAMEEAGDKAEDATDK
jgi:hyperosmotically inducible protein